MYLHQRNQQIDDRVLEAAIVTKALAKEASAAYDGLLGAIGKEGDALPMSIAQVMPVFTIGDAFMTKLKRKLEAPPVPQLTPGMATAIQDVHNTWTDRNDRKEVELKAAQEAERLAKEEADEERLAKEEADEQAMADVENADELHMTDEEIEASKRARARKKAEASKRAQARKKAEREEDMNEEKEATRDQEEEEDEDEEEDEEEEEDKDTELDLYLHDFNAKWGASAMVVAKALPPTPNTQLLVDRDADIAAIRRAEFDAVTNDVKASASVITWMASSSYTTIPLALPTESTFHSMCVYMRIFTDRTNWGTHLSLARTLCAMGYTFDASVAPVKVGRLAQNGKHMFVPHTKVREWMEKDLLQYCIMLVAFSVGMYSPRLKKGVCTVINDIATATTKVDVEYNGKAEAKEEEAPPAASPNAKRYTQMCAELVLSGAPSMCAELWKGMPTERPSHAATFFAELGNIVKRDEEAKKQQPANQKRDWTVHPIATLPDVLVYAKIIVVKLDELLYSNRDVIDVFELIRDNRFEVPLAVQNSMGAFAAAMCRALRFWITVRFGAALAHFASKAIQAARAGGIVDLETVFPILGMPTLEEQVELIKHDVMQADMSVGVDWAIAFDTVRTLFTDGPFSNIKGAVSGFVWNDVTMGDYAFGVDTNEVALKQLFAELEKKKTKTYKATPAETLVAATSFMDNILTVPSRRKCMLADGSAHTVWIQRARLHYRALCDVGAILGDVDVDEDDTRLAHFNDFKRTNSLDMYARVPSVFSNPTAWEITIPRYRHKPATWQFPLPEEEDVTAAAAAVVAKTHKTEVDLYVEAQQQQEEDDDVEMEDAMPTQTIEFVALGKNHTRVDVDEKAADGAEYVDLTASDVAKLDKGTRQAFVDWLFATDFKVDDFKEIIPNNADTPRDVHAKLEAFARAMVAHTYDEKGKKLEQTPIELVEFLDQLRFDLTMEPLHPLHRAALAEWAQLQDCHVWDHDLHETEDSKEMNARLESFVRQSARTLPVQWQINELQRTDATLHSVMLLVVHANVSDLGVTTVAAQPPKQQRQARAAAKEVARRKTMENRDARRHESATNALLQQTFRETLSNYLSAFVRNTSHVRKEAQRFVDMLHGGNGVVDGSAFYHAVSVLLLAVADTLRSANAISQLVVITAEVIHSAVVREVGEDDTDDLAVDAMKKRADVRRLLMPSLVATRFADDNAFRRWMPSAETTNTGASDVVMPEFKEQLARYVTSAVRVKRIATGKKGVAAPEIQLITAPDADFFVNLADLSQYKGFEYLRLLINRDMAQLGFDIDVANKEPAVKIALAKTILDNANRALLHYEKQPRAIDAQLGVPADESDVGGEDDDKVEEEQVHVARTMYEAPIGTLMRHLQKAEAALQRLGDHVHVAHTAADAAEILNTALAIADATPPTLPVAMKKEARPAFERAVYDAINMLLGDFAAANATDVATDVATSPRGKDEAEDVDMDRAVSSMDVEEDWNYQEEEGEEKKKENADSDEEDALEEKLARQIAESQNGVSAKEAYAAYVAFVKMTAGGRSKRSAAVKKQLDDLNAATHRVEQAQWRKHAAAFANATATSASASTATTNGIARSVVTTAWSNTCDWLDGFNGKNGIPLSTIWQYVLVQTCLVGGTHRLAVWNEGHVKALAKLNELAAAVNHDRYSRLSRLQCSLTAARSHRAAAAVNNSLLPEPVRRVVALDVALCMHRTDVLQAIRTHFAINAAGVAVLTHGEFANTNMNELDVVRPPADDAPKDVMDFATNHQLLIVQDIAEELGESLQFKLSSDVGMIGDPKLPPPSSNEFVTKSMTEIRDFENASIHHFSDHRTRVAAHRALHHTRQVVDGGLHVVYSRLLQASRNLVRLETGQDDILLKLARDVSTAVAELSKWARKAYVDNQAADAMANDNGGGGGGGDGVDDEQKEDVVMDDLQIALDTRDPERVMAALDIPMCVDDDELNAVMAVIKVAKDASK